MITQKIRLYENREDVTLTTYIRDSSAEKFKRPAIIICPGGAYLLCSDSESEPVALRFAAMGYHTFVLRYSVYTDEDHTFPSQDLKINEKSKTPAQIRDLGKAMLKIREHADEWNVDADKIAICGFSAGAHNCAMYSVSWNTPVLTDYFKVDPGMLRPTAAILGYTLSDFILLKQSQTSADDIGARLFMGCKLAVFGNIDPDDETLIKFSPALLVNKDTPPMFLWATSQDSLVPVEHTTWMATALAQKKIPFELHVFEEGRHGLSLANEGSAEVKSSIDRDAAKWVDLAECWLRKRLTFEMPEKSQWEL